MFNKYFIDEFFNNAFSYRPQVYVVSDTMIKQMQESQKDRTMKAIDTQISQLEDYKKEVLEYYENTLKLVEHKEEKTKKAA
jgi:adenylate kinase family enzyme